MINKIVFFGSGSYTIPIIENLIPHGLDLVITTEISGPITGFCKKNNVRVISAKTAKTLVNQKDLIANHALGVLASYGVLIPDEIINLFPNGIINIHPSLLPKWKGPSPIQYTLLNGDKLTGVTVIKMDSEFDHGPILSQKEYELEGTETTQELLNTLFKIGADQVSDLITLLNNGKVWTPIPQDHSKESWSEELARDSGKIDINNLKANSYKLKSMINAFYPWPGVWTQWKMGNGKVKIVKLLPSGMVQVEGKNPMNYKDFVNGYGEEGENLLEKLDL